MDTDKLATTGAVMDKPYIRVTFPVQGRYLPADHGYLKWLHFSGHVDTREISEH